MKIGHTRHQQDTVGHQSLLIKSTWELKPKYSWHVRQLFRQKMCLFFGRRPSPSDLPRVFHPAVTQDRSSFISGGGKGDCGYLGQGEPGEGLIGR